ncbi:hypothetical protein, partial [Streptomyces sp. SID4917]|uniref:SpnB-like Rossmann fold domain-containing protein n=1 Tax=Streptomyces sp. SID4917 TaxID=2690269 RepID=UPI0013691AAF
SLLAAAAEELPAEPARPAALLAALDAAGIEAPLWCVTRGAVSVAPSEAPLNVGQAIVWGLGRIAALEHPERWGGLIDLPEPSDERARAAFTRALTASDGEDQIAVRVDGTFGRRLIRTAATAPAEGGSWRPTGTVLVVGGTGAMGGRGAR